MFSNILKWTLKTVVDGVEKELNLHLDPDTPLISIEQAAVQMIAHCAKIKELHAAQETPVAPDAIDPPSHALNEDQTPAIPEGNEHA